MKETMRQKVAGFFDLKESCERIKENLRDPMAVIEVIGAVCMGAWAALLGLSGLAIATHAKPDVILSALGWRSLGLLAYSLPGSVSLVLAIETGVKALGRKPHKNNP